MKILKYLLFLILILLIGGSIYIATKDGKFQIEQTRVFNSPKELVYNEVVNFKNWQYWEPLSGDNTEETISYGDTLKGIGGMYMWENKQTGKGKIKTIDAKPFNEITQKIYFTNSMGESTSYLYWKFKEISEDKTQVTWGIKGTQSFREKLKFAFKDQSPSEIWKPLIDKGLSSLQTVIRNKMEKYNIKIEGVVNHGGGYYMYVTTATKLSQVPQKMKPMARQVSLFMDNQNIEQSKNPFVLYDERNLEHNSVIISVGYFTPNQIRTPQNANVLSAGMPNQKVLKIFLKGNRKNLPQAWEEAQKYISDNGLEINTESKPFEVFLNTSDDILNPADLETNIYIPIK